MMASHSQPGVADVAVAVAEGMKVRYSNAGNQRPSLGPEKLVRTTYAVVALAGEVGSWAEVEVRVRPGRHRIRGRGGQHFD